LTRLEAYFEYDANVSQTRAQVYQDWQKGVIQKESPTRICRYALDEVQLQSLKWTKGTQLSKKVMLLSPFDKTMEEPELPQEIIQSSSKSIDDFTAIEAEESNMESITTTNTLPAVVEGTPNVVGDTMLVTTNDEVLQKMILDTVQTCLTNFREEMLKEIKVDMKSMMSEVIKETIDKREQQTIVERGEDKINQLLKVNKPRIIEHISSAVREIQTVTENKITVAVKQHSESLVNQIRDKEQVIIKNIAIKRYILRKRCFFESKRDSIDAIDKIKKSHFIRVQLQHTGAL